MAGSSQTRSRPALYGHKPFLGDLQNPAPGFEEFLQYHVGNKHAAHWDQLPSKAGTGVQSQRCRGSGLFANLFLRIQLQL